eukprot:1958374-Pyramimonas_sp.AAC.1
MGVRARLGTRARPPRAVDREAADAKGFASSDPRATREAMKDRWRSVWSEKVDAADDPQRWRD